MDYPSDPQERLIVERRFALYADAAPVIIDIEEGLRAGDLRILERVDELDRILRASLAFLTPAVTDALNRFRDSTKDTLVGGRFDEDAAVEALADLHLALGNLLHDRQLHEMRKILHLPASHTSEEIPEPFVPAALEQPGRGIRDLWPLKKSEPVKAPPAPKEKKPPSARTKTTTIQAPPPNEIKAWQLQKKAQEHYENGKYKKAAKLYRRAIRHLPDQPAFYNDLGLALRKAGRLTEAIEEYNRAVELANRMPDKRGEEWYNAYFNLGNTYRALADGHLVAKKIKEAIAAHKQSISAFIEFLNFAAGSPNAVYAQKAVRINQADIQELERWMRIITGGRQKVDFDSIKVKLAEQHSREEAADDEKALEPPSLDSAKEAGESKTPEPEMAAIDDETAPTEDIPVAKPINEPEDDPAVQVEQTDADPEDANIPEARPAVQPEIQPDNSSKDNSNKEEDV
ncbi:MAG: tetratricopeptide repeat protein [Planctomycetota bacterium]|nr:MAG: tetratricopeptide repeat protein [Planctomycetota bacterium]